MKNFLAYLFIVLATLVLSSNSYAQKSKEDTLKEKYAWAFAIGNTVKAGLGTTFISAAYSPNSHFDFYLAPSWGMFTGGTAIFVGSKVNFFSKYKLYPNSDIAFRHSSAGYVNYENHDSGGQESYFIPRSDYFLAGLGINYRKKDKRNNRALTVFNLTINYNLALGEHHFEYGNGPFSKSGEDGATRKLAGGWGFTISYAGQIWKDKKKK
jgi:hypothetical protein